MIVASTVAAAADTAARMEETALAFQLAAPRLDAWATPVTAILHVMMAHGPAVEQVHATAVQTTVLVEQTSARMTDIRMTNVVSKPSMTGVVVVESAVSADTKQTAHTA